MQNRYIPGISSETSEIYEEALDKHGTRVLESVDYLLQIQNT